MGKIVLSPDLAPHGLLREACAEAQKRLDQRIARLDLTERAAYADALSRISAPVSALESGLEEGAGPRLFGDWRLRRRTDALRQDLQRLGGVFRFARASAIRDEAQAFGALYVLEGVRVGGRMFARQVAASGDPLVREATSFLRHREGQGQWPSFLIALNNSQAVSRDPRRAVDAALNAYSRFEDALK